MTTIELILTLPDSLAQTAIKAGLLKPEAIEHLLREAVRHQAVNEFFEAVDDLVAAEFPPMSLDEIQAEVNAVRAARKAERHL
jgi:hypothetical protein